jgi:hypothetical protein
MQGMRQSIIRRCAHRGDQCLGDDLPAKQPPLSVRWMKAAKQVAINRLEIQQHQQPLERPELGKGRNARR